MIDTFVVDKCEYEQCIYHNFIRMGCFLNKKTIAEYVEDLKVHADSKNCSVHIQLKKHQTRELLKNERSNGNKTT